MKKRIIWIIIMSLLFIGGTAYASWSQESNVSAVITVAPENNENNVTTAAPEVEP